MAQVCTVVRLDVIGLLLGTYSQLAPFVSTLTGSCCDICSGHTVDILEIIGNDLLNAMENHITTGLGNTNSLLLY